MALMAAAVGGSALLGAGTSLIGSGKASSAAKQAANTQMAMYNTTRGDLAPFRQAGQAELPQLNALLQGGNMQDTLNRMPGYQFALAQGLKSTQQAAAARGLGVSGAGLKGAAAYGTGLAEQYYTNLFNQTLQAANLGENAAAQTGSAGTAAAGAAGNFLNQAGLAGAAGVEGVGSAATGGVNNYLQYSLLQQAIANKGGTTGYGTTYPGSIPQNVQSGAVDPSMYYVPAGP